MKVFNLLFIEFIMLIHLFFSSVNASDFSDVFTQGKVDGEIRSVYYARSDDGSPFFPKAAGLAVGGFVGFTTHPVNNLSVRLALYTSQALSGDGSSLAATNLVNGDEDYFLLGQASIVYDDGISKLRIGRQEMFTPLAYSDDARMIQDLFNVVNFSTDALVNHTFHVLYFDSMTGMDNGNEKKDWTSMSRVLGTSYNKGMYALGVESSSIANLNAEAWYYDIPDTVSMLFAGTKYKQQLSNDLSLTYEAHYWKSKSRNAYEIDLAKKIDYDNIGFRISAVIDNLTLQLAYDHMAKKAGSHTIHTYHGNYAEYTYGFLLGSGAYGAISTGDENNDMTSMDAGKLTIQYKLNADTKFYLGYVMNTSDQSSLQSDLNILDIALFIDSTFHKDVYLAVIYENWDADGSNFFIDNNLIRATLKYKF